METAWINAHILFLLLHIFGTTLGAGAAYTGDTIFLQSVRNKIFLPRDMQIVKNTSRLIWVGLLILFLSGIGLVWQRPEIFLHSGKFWAKMTVIGVIIINGLLFHFRHFTTMQKSINKPFNKLNPLMKNRLALVLSGATSVLSWSFVIILGVFGRTPFTYFQFLFVYVLLLGGSWLIGYLIKDKLFSLSPQ